MSVGPRRLRVTKAVPVAGLCGMAFVDPLLATGVHRSLSLFLSLAHCI